VPIDHPDSPDDSDTPGPPDVPRPPDGPGSPDAIPRLPPGPANREAAHLAYRDTVDRANAAYQEHAADSTGNEASEAARDSWSEALPSLQAAWKEHQERNPEREQATPQTHADGSWSSGDARRLTPDQNTEAAKACADIREEGERVILPAMRRIEAADPDRRLAGLEHMLKGADRVKEKIADVLLVESQLTPRQAAAEVPDAVRFTLEYSESRYTAGVPVDVEGLKVLGYELLKLKNLWAKDQYKGVNSQWRRPETGLRFEVQFHTPESREAKELTHKAYERLRDPLTSKAEESALEDYQRRVNALIRLPPEVFTIEDYPPEKRDG
jgi:hypothetical protein